MRISRGERLALPEILRERFQDPRDLDAVGPGPRDQQLLDLLYLLFLRGGGLARSRARPRARSLDAVGLAVSQRRFSSGSFALKTETSVASVMSSSIVKPTSSRMTSTQCEQSPPMMQ